MIELNNFYIGESVTFMRENIPDNFVDLTVSSPPYDSLRKYNGFIFDYQSMLKELYRITKPGGVVVWVVGDKTDKGTETGTSFKHALYAKEEAKFNLHDTMIYQKKSCVYPDKNRYNNVFEYMFVFSKGKPNTYNLIADKKNSRFGEKVSGSQRKVDGTLDYNRSKLGEPIKEYGVRDNVWLIDSGYMKTTKDKDSYKHPAMFPEKLVSDHILTWSNEGDIVLDPMCGAGTTCKMAFLNKRNFIGIDISEEYINDICIPRLNTYGWEQNNNITFQECL